MTTLDIAQQRLHNHFSSRQTFEQPEYVAQWPSAVQSQDFAATK